MQTQLIKVEAVNDSQQPPRDGATNNKETGGQTDVQRLFVSAQRPSDNNGGGGYFQSLVLKSTQVVRLCPTNLILHRRSFFVGVGSNFLEYG